MQHLDRLVAKLQDVRAQGDGYRARCPAHNDQNPSLDVSAEGDGHIRLCCRSAGCSTTLILQALSLSPTDLWPDPNEASIFADDQLLIDSTPLDFATAGPALSESDIDLRSAVYINFLEQLVLLEQHRQDLRQRGLNDSEIDERGYRSLTFDTGRDAVLELCATFSHDELLTVPGFVVDGSGGIRITGPRQGLVIPVRDLAGRVVALKVRRDDDHEEFGKYASISGGGGPSCGAPTHVALGIPLAATTVRVTEGELKADVATVLSGMLTIGIAGINNWMPAIAVLHALPVASVHVAFDADCSTKPHVARCLSEFASALSDAGFKVKIETWNLDDGKGIDDLLAAGKHPVVLEDHDAANFLATILNGNTTSPESAETENVASIGSNAASPEPPPKKQVLPFPIEVFPHQLQEFIRQVAASVGCPVDLVAVPMLAVAATAIGASRALEARPGWRESARLYVAIVAPPGSGKSPAESIVTNPVHRLQNKYKAQHRKDKTAFETGEVLSPTPAAEPTAECQTNEFIVGTQSSIPEHDPTPLHTDTAACSATDVCTTVVTEEEIPPPLEPEDPMPVTTFETQQRTEAPVLRRVVVGDVTTEGLATILATNPRGILMARDEISSWIRGMNQYKGGKGNDRQFYLSCWSGHPALVDRKSQSEPVIIPRPFVNISGGIQPDMLPEFVDEKGRSDGFMDRVIFTYPEPVTSPLWSEQGVDWAVTQNWEDLLDRLFQLKMEHLEVEDVYEPHVLTFSEVAKPLWRDWYNEHLAETESLELPDALRGPWAKLRAYCLRFALTIQLIYSADEGIEACDVGSDAMRAAIKLIGYFKSHARKVYASLIRNAEDRRIELVLAWLSRHGGQCTARELQRSGVASIKKASEASAAMKDMADRGWGELVNQPNAQGKLITYFVMNPGLSGDVG